ncbi:hypothetical protein GCM10009618_14890 [Nesterenkonia lacusekhoensis]
MSAPFWLGMLTMLALQVTLVVLIILLNWATQRVAYQCGDCGFKTQGFGFHERLVTPKWKAKLQLQWHQLTAHRRMK